MRRFGLAYLHKDTLVQFVLYLEGLIQLKVRKNLERATQLFTQSLTSTETLNNELSRKSLLRLHELFNVKLAEIREQGLTPERDMVTPNLNREVTSRRRRPLKD